MAAKFQAGCKLEWESYEGGTRRTPAGTIAQPSAEENAGAVALSPSIEKTTITYTQKNNQTKRPQHTHTKTKPKPNQPPNQPKKKR